MRIGALSQRTGVSERALRYYEEQGLLSPLRRPSGYREYTDEHVHTVRSIRTLLAAGLGTATIADVLPCMVDEGGQLAAACPDLLLDLVRERNRISAAMEELRVAREMLDTIIAAPVPPEAARALDCDEAVGTEVGAARAPSS
ncbi:MerR family transcriptional regulator [Streptomyces sp. SAJ15]|uniref:MerR family transcriptional regulator n=1 Tax=Streptomyces sp. SAJ15 TaxID=2011095 RepID=UPI001186E485|nr:MerR family transcriptional regulator [Streptomyces sp. SAJ15]TVL90095.1 MerR family transcriptional regulator [Streptomyces sp. SAJ15]